VIHPYMVNQKAFQDYYPDELSHCYGCGRLNEHGLKIKSYWDGREAVAVLEPKPYHIGIPGYVYGGLIASLIDCHCIGTASAAALRAEGRNIETSLPLRYVTASLHVDYLQPTLIGVALEVRAKVREIKGRKVIVTATVLANQQICARGQVVAVRMPERMKPAGRKA
jgi:acyl-coenzyme A thioesterase PaaI-like protein